MHQSQGEPLSSIFSCICFEKLFHSITFCTWSLKPDVYETFEDIMDAIQKTQKNKYQAQIKYVEKHEQRVINLTNTSILARELNLSLNEVWNYGPYMMEYFPFPFTICTTLNLSFIQSPPKAGKVIINLSYAK